MARRGKQQPSSFPPWQATRASGVAMRRFTQHGGRTRMAAAARRRNTYDSLFSWDGNDPSSQEAAEKEDQEEVHKLPSTLSLYQVEIWRGGTVPLCGNLRKSRVAGGGSLHTNRVCLLSTKNMLNFAAQDMPDTEWDDTGVFCRSQVFYFFLSLRLTVCTRLREYVFCTVWLSVYLLSVCMYVCFSQSVSQSVYFSQSVSQSVSVCLFQYACLSVSVCISVCFSLSVCLFQYVWLSVCLFQSVCLPVSGCVCLF